MLARLLTIVLVLLGQFGSRVCTCAATSPGQAEENSLTFHAIFTPHCDCICKSHSERELVPTADHFEIGCDSCSTFDLGNSDHQRQPHDHPLHENECPATNPTVVATVVVNASGIELSSEFDFGPWLTVEPLPFLVSTYFRTNHSSRISHVVPLYISLQNLRN